MRELDYPSYRSAVGPRLRWSPIAAGAVVSIAVMACLTLLGIGLGFVSLEDGARWSPRSGLLVHAAALWPLVAGCAAFFSGGWIAARLSDCGRRADGAIFGLITWAVGAIAGFVVVGAIVGAGAGYGGAALGSAGVLGFCLMAFEALSAAVGGVFGARLFLPKPVARYRREHRAEVVGISGSGS
jgi:hypothetical protein